MVHIQICCSVLLAAACACLLTQVQARDQETPKDKVNNDGGKGPSRNQTRQDGQDLFIFKAGGHMRSVSCNFERSDCGIELLNGATWTSGSQGMRGAPHNKPAVDFTTGTHSGKYVYMNVSGLRADGQRWFKLPLRVPQSHTDPHPYCLEFAYHKAGDTGYTALIAWMSKDGNWHWPLPQRATSWKKTSYTFLLDRSTRGFYWMVQANKDNAVGGFAVDDVKITADRCSGNSPAVNENLPLARCDFDMDRCLTEFENKGTLTDGTPSSNTYQPKDNTGMYAYLDVTGLKVGEKSSLKQVVRAPNNRNTAVCLQLRYHLYGNHKHTFVVGWATPTSGEWENFWTSAHKDEWVYLQRTFILDVKVDNTFTLKAVTTGENAVGGVAVDNLAIIRNACPGNEEPVNANFPYFGCSFDTGNCGIEFFRHATLSDGTEQSNQFQPRIRTGKYAYLDATGLKTRETSSLKVSVTIPAGKKALSCVKIRYHLNGNERHTFVLTRATALSGAWEYIRAKVHKDEWILWEETFLLDAGVTNTFTLKAVSTGHGSLGGVAVDYIIIDKKACKGSSTPINGALPVAACFFDPAVCEHFQLKQNAVLTSGTNSFIDTYKPSADILELKNGQYVYLHMQSLNIGAAEMWIQIDQSKMNTRNHCLWFSYTSVGGGFHFDVSWKHDGGQWNQLLKDTTMTSWRWYGMDATFETWKTTYVRFRAVPSSGNPVGGVAIDNAQLYKGRCNASWGAWGPWSACDNKCNRFRERRCRGQGVCTEHARQTGTCDPTTCTIINAPAA